MDVNSFANYLLALIIVLQLVGMIIFLVFFRYIGMKALPAAAVLMFVIDSTALYYFQKIDVYDKNEKKVDNIFDVLGDVLAITAWSAIISVLLIAVGIFFSIRIAVENGRNKVAAVFLPFISTAVFYGSLLFVAKVKN